MSATTQLPPRPLAPAPPPAASLPPAPPASSPPGSQHRWEQALTGLLVLGPLAFAAWALVRVGTHPPTLLDLGLAVVMYGLTGYGVTVGFHRLTAHRAFTARRGRSSVGLAVAGSMAFQGPLVGWVADHRRHHAYTDRDGDPHTPHGASGRVLAPGRGALHAHTGWLFRHDPTDADRYARDVLARCRPAAHRRAVPALVRAVPRAALRRRLAARRLARRRGKRPPVGRRGPDRGAPPGDVEHQLPLPPRGTASPRHEGPQHEPRRCCRSSRWASRSTTTTTRSPARPATVWTAANGTPRPCSSRSSDGWGGPPTCTAAIAGPRRPPVGLASSVDGMALRRYSELRGRRMRLDEAVLERFVMSRPGFQYLRHVRRGSTGSSSPARAVG